MTQYLCKTVTELPAYMQANFIVAEGTQINAGDVYVAKELNENLHGNWTVYNADMIEDVSKEIPTIVINNSFETLADGRRPDGQPDYTQYAYEEGEVVTAIKLLPEIKMEISFDIIQNRNDIESKGYLIPENGTNLLRFVSTIDDVDSKVYFVIEALKHFRCGGAMGMGFIDTMVVRVKYMPAKPKDQKITGIQADIVQGLKVGDANVASGATVLTMNAIGGTQPYQYTLIPDGEVAQDNDKFVINSAEVKVGANALTEAKTYKIYVQATDSKGKTFKEGFDIPVAEA